MTPRRRSLALAVATSLALAGCGGAAKEAAGRSLEEDSDRAREALAASREASFVLRFADDPQGTLKKAMLTPSGGDEPLTPGQADAVLGSQIRVQLDPNGDRTLRDYAASTGTTEADLRANDTAFTVRSGDGTLLEVRVADGDLYLGTDYAAVRKTAEHAGGAESLDAALASAPQEVSRLVADLKAGKWLRVPLADLLEQLEAAGAVPTPTATPDAKKLLADLSAAIRPNVRLRDLGEKDGVREVRVEVDAKKALGGLLDVVRRQPGVPPIPFSELKDLSDRPVTATLRIEDGHYTRLTVPLQGLLELDATPDADVPPLGASALVLEIDDTAEEVVAPEQVSSFDVGALLQPLLAGLTSAGALGGETLPQS